jgi:hypothetical protein
MAFAGASKKADSSGNQQGSSNKQLGIQTELTEAEKYWIAGFIEGEGSFNVSYKIHPNSVLGFYPCPEFSVSQHVVGIQCLHRCQKALGGIGRIFKKPSPSGRSSNVWVYAVNSPEEIVNVVMPFITQYSPYTVRNNEMGMLFDICNRMIKSEHLTPEGLKQIVELGYTVKNKKSNRKYTKEELLSVIGDRKKAQELSRSRKNRTDD